ncbi:MAG: NAD-dependent epimerase/dehydratase family protein [Bifidobacterium longum]
MTRAPSATSTPARAQLLLEGKRAAENLCVSYHSEYQVPVKAVRLAQTFGPGIPRDDVRLFAALARNAVAARTSS